MERFIKVCTVTFLIIFASALSLQNLYAASPKSVAPSKQVQQAAVETKKTEVSTTSEILVKPPALVKPEVKNLQTEPDKTPASVTAVISEQPVSSQQLSAQETELAKYIDARKFEIEILEKQLAEIEQNRQAALIPLFENGMVVAGR